MVNSLALFLLLILRSRRQCMLTRRTPLFVQLSQISAVIPPTLAHQCDGCGNLETFRLRHACVLYCLESAVSSFCFVTSFFYVGPPSNDGLQWDRLRPGYRDDYSLWQAQLKLEIPEERRKP